MPTSNDIHRAVKSFLRRQGTLTFEELQERSKIPRELLESSLEELHAAGTLYKRHRLSFNGILIGYYPNPNFIPRRFAHPDIEEHLPGVVQIFDSEHGTVEITYTLKQKRKEPPFVFRTSEDVFFEDYNENGEVLVWEESQWCKTYHTYLRRGDIWKPHHVDSPSDELLAQSEAMRAGL